MNLLTPLGLLGLIGLIALVAIYLLKPNYQHKAVSSTYIWKLSLKYKRKSVPISKLRNILLLICQILIIVLCAFMLTQPFVSSDNPAARAEKIFILDASASMQTEKEGVTRFERAVNMIKDDTAAALADENGMVTIILAGEKAECVFKRETAEGLSSINAELAAFANPVNGSCTYGEADVSGALGLAEEVLMQNPEAEVVFYTDNTYVNSGDVTVRNVFDKGTEWNASIGDVSATVSSGYYIFRAVVGCYGRNTQLTLNLDIYGTNSEQRTISVSYDLRFENDETKTLIIRTRPKFTADGEEFEDEDKIEEGAIYLDYADTAIYSFESVHAYFSELDDSFDKDDTFDLYGGKQEKLRVQYYSSKSNPFVAAAIMGQREILKKKWDVEFVQVQSGDPEFEGFDFYIFEDTMPIVVPTDGVVMLLNPQTIPFNVSMAINQTPKTGVFTLEAGTEHPITSYLPLNEIGVSSYLTAISSDGFDELMYCNGEPVFFAKNEVDCKQMVMLFSVNMSHQAIFVDFPMMFGNIFDYYFPQTIDKTVFNVGESVSIRARGESINVTGPEMNDTFTAFPSSVKLVQPGKYTLTQPIMAPLTYATRFSVRNFFVRVPMSENNIYAEFDEIPPLQGAKKPEPASVDLVFYLAIALVVLLFAEWFLQSKVRF